MARKSFSREKVPITLRLDVDVHEALRVISSIEMRSLNTQIEYFLREAVFEYIAKNEDDYVADPLRNAAERIVSKMSEPVAAEDP